ncbi:MAG: VOC family protein [Pseudomonadota bacterium]
MPETQGLNHLGLSVDNLDQTVAFFVECLGWEESGRDESYPRSAVSDGHLRLTLWQVDHDLSVNPFQMRQNVGLHHLAIEVASENQLYRLAEKVGSYPGVEVEFLPELLGDGPRRHMIFYEPGGIRLELIWPGNQAGID